jgi:putative nucleotidyltransferase with HDIG domain
MFKVFLNGMLCLFIVPGLLSPLEKIFGITTDIQLLEYSDLNNEVLSMLAIEIPATYAHSLMLGQLAEAASDAIGANGLLARVCAYYHDIGKMRRPEYFSENQAGYNIHDELSPRLSARAISAHVTYGVEMARDYHLPKPIIDGIKEHHGTTLIGYFYQQAVKAQKHGDVREEDFRYPGPKPQSRETAILMICDAVESGVRSIKNPNEERVREFVDKIIAARNADRQFDECNLTLKELDTIAEVITRRMWSSLHTRVAYPDVKKDKQESEANIIPIAGRTP